MKIRLQKHHRLDLQVLFAMIYFELYLLMRLQCKTSHDIMRETAYLH